MSEDSNKLLETIMGALGDNPSETISQMLSSLGATSSEGCDEAEEAQQESGGGIDLDMILKIQGLMGQLNQNSQDERSALLSAIRPFLSEERRPQVDQAMKLLKLTQLAKTAQDMDLFKGLL